MKFEPLDYRPGAGKPPSFMRGMRAPLLAGRERGGGVCWVIPCEKGIHGPSHEFCQGKSLTKRPLCAIAPFVFL